MQLFQPNFSVLLCAGYKQSFLTLFKNNFLFIHNAYQWYYKHGCLNSQFYNRIDICPIDNCSKMVQLLGPKTHEVMSSNPVVNWVDVRKLAIRLKRKIIIVAKWCTTKKYCLKGRQSHEKTFLIPRLVFLKPGVATQLCVAQIIQCVAK